MFEALDFQSRAAGVGHEVQPLSGVRRTDARSAQIRRPDGVTASFQISENNVEPPEAILARNLLSKDDWRATLCDECEPCWPKMSRVANSFPLARVAERLAGAGSSPDVGVIGDAGEAEGVGPPTDSGEEVPLSRPSDICGAEIGDGTAVDLSWGDVVMGDEALQPSGCEGVVLVVGGHRGISSSNRSTARARRWSISCHLAPSRPRSARASLTACS
jgi:hypothetical protein